jgi:hypothetical protein
MRKTVLVELFSWNQPNSLAWSKAQELIAAWNAGHAQHWTLWGSSEIGSYKITLDDANGAEVKELEEQVAEYQRRYGVEVDWLFTTIYDEDDFDHADMVLLRGFNLHNYVANLQRGLALQRSFVTNLEDNSLPASPCTECGWIDDLSAGSQHGPFVIDEFVINHIYDPETGTWEEANHAWDFVSIPGGFTLVSNRILEEFRRHRIRGYHTLEVISRDTGEPSNAMSQLFPNRWVAQLCIEHSRVTGGVCSTCGRVLGVMEGDLHLHREWVGDDEIIGRRPGGLRSIFFAQRPFQLLKSLHAKGMEPKAPLYLCDHGFHSSADSGAIDGTSPSVPQNSRRE